MQAAGWTMRELQDGRELQEEQELVKENIKDNPKRYNELLDMSGVFVTTGTFAV